MQVEILKQHIVKLDKDSFAKLRDWFFELDRCLITTESKLLYKW